MREGIEKKVSLKCLSDCRYDFHVIALVYSHPAESRVAIIVPTSIPSNASQPPRKLERSSATHVTPNQPPHYSNCPVPSLTARSHPLTHTLFLSPSLSLQSVASAFLFLFRLVGLIMAVVATRSPSSPALRSTIPTSTSSSSARPRATATYSPPHAHCVAVTHWLATPPTTPTATVADSSYNQ